MILDILMKALNLLSFAHCRHCNRRLTDEDQIFIVAGEYYCVQCVPIKPGNKRYLICLTKTQEEEIPLP